MNKIFYIAIGLMLILACRNTTTSTTPDTTMGKDTMMRHESDHGNVMQVKLNNGQKWNANPETTQGISNMTTLVNNLPTQPTREDYKVLGTKLETAFNEIIQKCTMTGEAHTQLHLYLMPMTSMIEELKGGEFAEAKDVTGELKSHLAEYNKYFQ